MSIKLIAKLKELKNYDKVKNNEQIKALVDFLEYLFLIQDPGLESKYEEFKKSQGGVLKMSVDEIRKIYYTEKGREKGIEEGANEKAIAIAEKMLRRGNSIEEIVDITELSRERVIELKNKYKN